MMSIDIPLSAYYRLFMVKKNNAIESILLQILEIFELLIVNNCIVIHVSLNAVILSGL